MDRFIISMLILAWVLLAILEYKGQYHKSLAAAIIGGGIYAMIGLTVGAIAGVLLYMLINGVAS